MKVGQRGKIIKLTSIGCEPHGEWPVLTADETWVDEGNFTIVEVHSDCIVINFDYGHRDAENVDAIDAADEAEGPATPASDAPSE